ncbi:MAG: FAD-binding protein [Acetobacteraceae bacterium]|nr:FAD-binding protein [Acetobacteraceae bacterium]
MTRVLISGAGIAGLSLALRLHQRGLKPIVVERAPRLRDGGYTLGLSDPGYHAAERMGIADALRAAHYVPGRLAYVDGRGRERFAIGGRTVERFVGPRQLSLMRGDIERVLHDRVRAFSESASGPPSRPSTRGGAACARRWKTGPASKPTWSSAPTACTRRCARFASVRRRGSCARSASGSPPSSSTARSTR